MAKTYKDFSQLTKAIVRKDEPPKPVRKPAAVDSCEEADCLAYFSHTSLTDPRHATSGRVKAPSVPPPDPTIGALKAAEARLAAELERVRQDLAAAESRANAAERELEAHVARQGALDERQARLEAEVRALRAQVAEAQVVSVSPEPEPPARSPEPGQRAKLLTSPADFLEMFPGEVREMVIAALADALATAVQGTRERRAAVLEAVLSANVSSGELERRRTELRRILKDASNSHGEQTIRAMEKLGLKLISGKRHWKLEYGNVRMPMSKTPSDWRTCLNTSADMANRCF